MPARTALRGRAEALIIGDIEERVNTHHDGGARQLKYLCLVGKTVFPAPAPSLWWMQGLGEGGVALVVELARDSSRVSSHATSETTTTSSSIANMPPKPQHHQKKLHSLTPNSCLLAVLLVIRSSSGPALTFHYPPRPRFDSPLGRSTRSYSSSSSSSSSSSGDDDDVDEASRLSPTATGAASDTESRTRYSRRDTGTTNGDDESKGGKKKYGGSDTLLGFKRDFLAGMLAPKMAAAKGRFEMSVDDVVFLGAPVHVRSDGSWRKRKRRRRKGPAGGDDDEEEDEEDDVDVDEAVVEEEGSIEPEEVTAPTTPHEENDADDERDDGRDSENNQGTMNMFHVVFVLNPPELEYHFRTDEIFDYVVKRFSRALKYEQAKDGYVYREADKISRLKEQAAQKGRCSPLRRTRPVTLTRW